MSSSEMKVRNALTGASLIAAICLISAPAWAYEGFSINPLGVPGDFMFIWVLATILAGWIGSWWTLGSLWKHREELGGWRLAGISALGAPVFGFIGTFFYAVIDASELGVGASNFDQTFWGLAAIGMAVVYQTGYSLGAYRVFRKRDVAD